jgi:glycerol-3-phosphate dehydrogenase
MPIVDAVARVLFQGDSPTQMVQRLLAREARDEAN